MSSGSVGAEPSDHSRCSRIARVRTGQGTTMTGMPAFSASTNRRGGLRPGGGGSPRCIRSEKQFPQHVGVRTCESFSQQLRPVDIVGGDHRVYSFVRVTLVGPSKNHAMTISFRLRHAARTDQARLIHHSAGRNPCAACRRQRGRGRSAADRDRGRHGNGPTRTKRLSRASTTYVRAPTRRGCRQRWLPTAAVVPRTHQFGRCLLRARSRRASTG
jgi:hypothetical protein